MCGKACASMSSLPEIESIRSDRDKDYRTLDRLLHWAGISRKTSAELIESRRRTPMRTPASVPAPA